MTIPNSPLKALKQLKSKILPILDVPCGGASLGGASEGALGRSKLSSLITHTLICHGEVCDGWCFNNIKPSATFYQTDLRDDSAIRLQIPESQPSCHAVMLPPALH